MFYVIVLRQEYESGGNRVIPGRLWGPKSWVDCVEQVKSLLKQGKVKLPENWEDVVELDGYYRYPDGGGIYIIYGD